MSDFPFYSLQDVPEHAQLKALISSMIALEDYDLEEIEYLIAEHVANHCYQISLDPNDRRHSEDNDKAYFALNSAGNIIDDVINDILPDSRKTTEALMDFIWGRSNFAATKRLLEDLREYQSIEEYSHNYASLAEYIDEIAEWFLTPEEFVSECEGIVLCGVIDRETKTREGYIVSALASSWNRLISFIEANPDAYRQIGPEKWEEIIAGALSLDPFGYDRITLTPRSGDHGRDIIAEKDGWPSLRILYSVKSGASPVSYDHIRSLIGVLSSDLNASKAILTTTSTLPTNVYRDPLIKLHVPNRIQILDGPELRKWLSKIRSR